MNGALDYFGSGETIAFLETALREGAPRPDRLVAQFAWTCASAIRPAPGSSQSRWCSNNTIVIALTASSFDEERDAIMAGCDDYMRKPLDDGVLLETMARHLGLTLRYEDVVATTTREADPATTGVRLAPALRERLAAALERRDVPAIEEAMKQVRAGDPSFASEFQPLQDRFDYGRPAKLLQSSAESEFAARSAGAVSRTS